jgi:predicted SAM-dependent methyltransferase
MNHLKHGDMRSPTPFARLSGYIKAELRSYRFRMRTKTRPLRLVVGASGIYDAGWIPSDAEYLNLLNAYHWKTYFEKASIDAILAEHVWEHLTADDGLAAAGRCFEYLRPGGYLRVGVPDGFHPDPKYLDYVRPGGSGPGAGDHRVLYNHITFAGLFEKAGFDVRLLEYFDSNGKFHCVDWSPDSGKVGRSMRFDARNAGGTLNYTSIILDAYKGKSLDD